jgi:hypothetical protein
MALDFSSQDGISPAMAAAGILLTAGLDLTVAYT